MAARYAQAHQDPQGPGDARPTTSQIIQDEGLLNGLTGKSVFITGTSSGIGIETAKTFFTTGATLYLTARDLTKAKNALGSELIDSPRVFLIEMDQNSLASVRAAAAKFLSLTDKLNIFIGNAGIMATPEGRTADSFELQFGVNHLSHFLLFILLRPALLAAATPEHNSRAIFLSSVSHRWGEVHFDNIPLKGEYDPWKSYSQSKTANVWTANEADRRYGKQGLRVFSVHPGGIMTGLVQHMSQEDIDNLSADPNLGRIMKSPEQGAATTVWAATSKSLEGNGGKYLENVQVAGPWEPSTGRWGTGYAPHAYSPEKEARLWELSLKLVGEKDDEA
jgi:NAD(P)-dependent dehydrogenase (short-subunit alcohol dehydrogenase family)